MEITQSEAVQYFLDEWPEELEEKRRNEFSRRTYDRVDEEYSLLDRFKPGNAYRTQAASELALNPEEPETERAQELKRELQKPHNFYPEFTEEEFADWEMEWMADFLPLEMKGRQNSNFGERKGSENVYQWNDLEIGRDKDGKYVAFNSEPIHDMRDVLTDLAAEFDITENNSSGIDLESETKRSYVVTAEGSRPDTPTQHQYNVSYSGDDIELDGTAEGLNVKIQAEYADHVDEVLEILGWEDQTSNVDTTV